MPDWSLERKRFISSLMFYTRLPIPRAWQEPVEGPDGAIQPTRYFPLIGVLLGILCVLTFVNAQRFFLPELSILFGLSLAIWITGALHEDGLADSADGFGAGWDATEIHRIMKDSRIGVYGVLSLVLVLLIKFESLLQIGADNLPSVWIAGQAFSRLLAIGLLFRLEYVTSSGSKSATMVNLNFNDWVVAGLCGLLPLLFVGTAVIPAVLVLILLFFGMQHFFSLRLGGVTGDCLGAAQQLSEVLFYIVLALTLNH